MNKQTNTRITIDIPTNNHKKLKMLAALQGKSMREMFIDFIERGLAEYEECKHSHIPNETTKKALKKAKEKNEAYSATTTEELFKKLVK